MVIGIFYQHPVNGSLGSFRRVREIATSLACELNTQACIFTPYEQDKIISKHLSIKSIPNLALSWGLNTNLYDISRIVYYNKYLMKSLLTFAAKNSSKFLSGKLAALMKK